jgi:acyl-CoA reductase-like NAD-dependent aldehyde dehydrogenase
LLLDVLVDRRDDPGSSPPLLGSWIGGTTAVAGDGDLIDVHDPATGRALARIEEAGPAGVDRAVTAAKAAAAGWRRTPARERGALVAALADRITAVAERLAILDTLDTGNPITAMRADVAKGARTLADTAGLALEVKGETFPLPGLHYTAREPWGVVGRMITFNHPTMFTAARLGAALVAGNTVVLKPSELAPLSAVAIGELAAGALPDGVVNVVVGGPATGAALVAHPAIERLSFTGSTATALRIQAAAAASGRIKTLTFELGGKNPIVVFDDVDIDEAATAVVRGMNFTRVQGQSCGSTSRLIAHRSIAEPLLERVAERAGRIRIGMPLDEATEMGSMISAAARDRCIDLVNAAVRDGARLAAGGLPPSDATLSGGAFLAPTVVDHVPDGAPLALQEVFGPVLTTTTFDDEAEAITLANAGRYGLTAAIWTQDIDRALRLTEAIEAGYVWVNDVETRFPAVPFGGWKDSGVGAEHGIEEIRSFTRVKAVNVRVR